MDNATPVLKKILEELSLLREDVGIIGADLNAIRNGEYDKPQGAMRPHPKAPSPDGPRVTSREW